MVFFNASFIQKKFMIWWCLDGVQGFWIKVHDIGLVIGNKHITKGK
jgi:hypothetical protein